MAHKPDEWMPLDIREYLGDTTHLTRDQHGAYLLLLMAYWMRGGALPSDDKQLATISKCTMAEWRTMKPIISDFFRDRDGKWFQKRAEKELEKARTLIEAKSKGGKKGAEKRWHKHESANDKTIADPPPSVKDSLCLNDGPLPLPLPDCSLEQSISPPAALDEPEIPAFLRRKKKEPDRFEEFYAIYPLKRDKGHALKAWPKAVTMATAEQIIAAVKVYAAQRSGEDEKFTKYPATWLKGMCWLDHARSLNGAGPSLDQLLASKAKAEQAGIRTDKLDKAIAELTEKRAAA